MAEPLSDPERELALIYANPDARACLRALWALDEKFASVVAGTSEPTIGEMRLLWWREALETIAVKVPAEPLLQQIEDAIRDFGADVAQWGAMAEGWHALLQEPIDEAELQRYASERGGSLFRLSAELLGDDAPLWLEPAGRGWALIELARHVSDAELADDALQMAHEELSEIGDVRVPRALRSIGALTVLARRDCMSSNLKHRKGSPGRIARMVWHRMTGV